MTEGRCWVVDTNVLISRLLCPAGTAAKAVDQALSSGILLFSDATLTELTAVLDRPRFDPYVSTDDRREFVRLLGGVSRIVSVVHQVRACRDPRDDKFLDLALAGSANAIITGGNDLLVLDPFYGVSIISPTAFVEK